MKNLVRNLKIIETLLVLAALIMERDPVLRGILFLAFIAGGLCIGMIFYFRRADKTLLTDYEMEEDSDKIDFQIAETVKKYPFLRSRTDAVSQYVDNKIRVNNARIFDKQTELTALQSQINPHFLYNTLDSIRGEALSNDDRTAAKMIETLATFFRYSISKKRTMVRLRDELGNVQNYMKIQQYRFNNRFSLEINIDDEDRIAFEYLVPKLILQPVVENAIFHGLDEKEKDGVVSIEITLTDKDMILTVSDNGCGMPAEELNRLNERIHSGNYQLDDGKNETQRNTGIALPNIHKRIQLLFGSKYGIDVYSSEGVGTDVEIMVPIRYEEE